MRNLPESLEYCQLIMNKKISYKYSTQLMQGILAGVFIALATWGYLNSIFSIENPSLARVIGGVVFTSGLIFVILSYAQLFTGNLIGVMPLLKKSLPFLPYLKNLVVVFLGNVIGVLGVVFLVDYSGQLLNGKGLLGAITIQIALKKLSYTFTEALLLGILCNVLVCLAIWLGTMAKSIGGKVVTIFIPISLFIISGFEHSIANVFFIPIALFAKGNPIVIEALASIGVNQDQLGALTINGFLMNNLTPVIIGNIIGGVLISVLLFFAYREESWTIKNK